MRGVALDDQAEPVRASSSTNPTSGVTMTGRAAAMASGHIAEVLEIEGGRSCVAPPSKAALSACHGSKTVGARPPSSPRHHPEPRRSPSSSGRRTSVASGKTGAFPPADRGPSSSSDARAGSRAYGAPLAGARGSADRRSVVARPRSGKRMDARQPSPGLAQLERTLWSAAAHRQRLLDSAAKAPFARPRRRGEVTPASRVGI